MHGKGEIMGRFVKKIKNKQYGQAMAEFALTLPIFLLLVFGVIELSRFFLVYSSVFTASREATRYASSVGQSNDSKNYENCEEIANRAVASGWFGGVSNLHDDPNAIDTINIYYEDTPGHIIGSCHKVMPEDENDVLEYVLLKGECYAEDSLLSDCVSDKPFIPELGDRVVVEVITTYRPILGIIPQLPVRASNGRTIMTEIRVYSTPITYPSCNEVVYFEDSLIPIDNELDNSFYIEMINDSIISHYTIDQIDLNWTFDESEENSPKLGEIQWGIDNKYIWREVDDDEEEVELDGSPPISIQSWSSPNTRNLTAKLDEDDDPVPYPLTFVFDQPIDIDELEFTFTLKVINSRIQDDTCDPVTEKGG
jgi:hypothetical protein